MSTDGDNIVRGKIRRIMSIRGKRNNSSKESKDTKTTHNKGVDLQHVVRCKITDKEIIEMDTSMPIAVQMRLKLNKAGFKFEDDGKPSVIINEYPIPLGNMEMWTDEETKTRHYKQVI